MSDSEMHLLASKGAFRPWRPHAPYLLRESGVSARRHASWEKLMLDNKIRINDEILRRNVLNYLRSPSGQKVLQEFGCDYVLASIASLFGLVFGLCLLPTIVFTRGGLRIIGKVLALKCFENYASEVKGDPERLVPLIAHGIVIGPSSRHALVLGTFRSAAECSPDLLAQKAAFLGRVYTCEGDGAGSEHAALRKLLRDDTFTRHRRRRVPAAYADGQPLLLFDAEISSFDGESDADPGQITPYGTVLIPFVANFGDQAKHGEEGELRSIPWSAVRDAVTIQN